MKFGIIFLGEMGNCYEWNWALILSCNFHFRVLFFLNKVWLDFERCLSWSRNSSIIDPKWVKLKWNISNCKALDFVFTRYAQYLQHAVIFIMDLIKQYWYIGNAVQTMNLLKYLLIILFIYKCYAVMECIIWIQILASQPPSWCSVKLMIIKRRSFLPYKFFNFNS